MENVVRVEALRPGVNTVNHAERGEYREEAVKQGEVLEFSDQRVFSCMGTSLSFKSSSEGNSVDVSYTAPMEDFLSPTKSKPPKATVYYSFGYHPRHTSVEFGKSRTTIGSGQAMIRATYLGHKLREVVAPMFTPDLPSDPIRYYNSPHNQGILVAMSPIIHSDNLFALNNLPHEVPNPKDGFAGSARFYVELGAHPRGIGDTRGITIAFATMDDSERLIRIKARDVVSVSSFASQYIGNLSIHYARRLAEIGAFLGILAENPGYYPPLQEKGLNLELLNLFVEPSIYHDLYKQPKYPYYDECDIRMKNFMRYEGINWGQVLRDLPDITEETLKLDDLIKNPGFPKPEKVAV